MIERFHAQLPVRIRFGPGVVGALAEVIGDRRALVVSEPPVLAIDAVAAAVAGLPLYEKQPGEPTPDLVADAAARAVAEQPEVLVAVGGGSAIDLAKAARLVAGQGRPIEAFLAGDAAIAVATVDLIAVPTTSGTGSEVSGGSVVVDPVQGRKLGVAHPLMRAQDALVDPLLTLALPPESTAYTGADALAQAIGIDPAGDEDDDHLGRPRLRRDRHRGRTTRRAPEGSGHLPPAVPRRGWAARCSKCASRSTPCTSRRATPGTPTTAAGSPTARSGPR